MNRSFETIQGETFQGVIEKVNFMGASFINCIFLPGTEFVRCRMDRVEFLDCTGLDEVELGHGTRADDAVTKNNKRWNPKKVKPTVRKGKSGKGDTDEAEAQLEIIRQRAEDEGDQEKVAKYEERKNLVKLRDKATDN